MSQRRRRHRGIDLILLPRDRQVLLAHAAGSRRSSAPHRRHCRSPCRSSAAGSCRPSRRSGDAPAVPSTRSLAISAWGLVWIGNRVVRHRHDSLQYCRDQRAGNRVPPGATMRKMLVEFNLKFVRRVQRAGIPLLGIKILSAPSSRSTMVSTSTMLAPSSRSAGTAWIAEPPVVVTSSTTTTFSRARSRPWASLRPASWRRDPSASCARRTPPDCRRAGGSRSRRGRDRDRAHFQPADEIHLHAFQRIDDQLADAARARRMNRRRAHVEVVVALASDASLILPRPNERARNSSNSSSR